MTLNGLQKLYDPIVFLHAAGNAKKARRRLPRLTKICNQLVSMREFSHEI